MHLSFRRILLGALVFSLTIIIAIAGYILAGWSPLDAIYMVVITVFGVGYGEVRPITSPNLRIFTILVIIAGTSSAVYIVGGFIQMVTEGEINRVFDARRMMRDIETLKQHVIICGFGRMGQILSRQMQDTGHSFIVIDNNVDRIAEAETFGYLVLTGDATDEAVLETAGIRRAKILATVLSEDALNVFITLTARGLNPELTILARGEFPSTEKKLKQAGADHVVLPAAIGALRMAHLITHPAALDLLDPNDGRSNLNELLAQVDVQIDELAITSGSPLIGSTISNLELHGKGTFIVIALRRADGSKIIHPDARIALSVGDTVIVMGHRSDIPRFAHYYRLRRQTSYRGVKL